MIQNNYFNENPDIQLQFQKLLDWKEIVNLYEDGFRDAKKYKDTKDEKFSMAPNSVEEAIETYRTVLEAIGELTGSEIAPRAPEMDKIGLKFDNGKVTFPKPMTEAYNVVKEAGLQPYSISRKYGGLGIPCVVQSMVMEVLARGDAALSIAIGCVNLAETIERFASKEMKEAVIPRMASGEITGAMALTEPNYGSDLPNVQTRAVKAEDGTWRLTGTKRFITHGCGFTDTPAVILTLARTGGPTSGARGLSFFLVKSEDVEIAGIERKLGLHCSPTCEVVFDNAPGEIIGQEGMGLVKYAMGMMNNARLSIASQAMGIASAALFEAKKYASERQQFGKLIQEIPAVKKMIDRMERECAAMRCLLYEAAGSVDHYVWKLEHLESDGKTEKEIRADEEIRFWEKMANLFTPLSKYYISEMCNIVASDALQIHGGSGYTEDYDVARIYRDARITNIYEGTTQ
ncbi:MAG: acyl-CoA dehydrogenase family protein, partial [Spirochaetia bacterium]|nr:acyl-CoA dehydrogenase family protein [Spirochaetia bacterium]